MPTPVPAGHPLDTQHDCGPVEKEDVCSSAGIPKGLKSIIEPRAFSF